MTDLLLDADVVAKCCAGDLNNFRNFVRERHYIGFRNWLYVGQVAQITDLLNQQALIDGVPYPEKVATERFEEFNVDCHWLSALTEDVEVSANDDLLAEALIKAARRLGGNTLIVTCVKSRVRRGLPFISPDAAISDSGEPPLQLVDLRAQQDRIRSVLEANLHRVLNHGQYISGPEVSQLESRLADHVGVKHCVCVSSGTDALLIAMMALGVGSGDEVITSPFSFFATAEAIALLGAKPIFVDIDPITFNIDANRIESAVTKRTRAILPVSLYGQCADLGTINAVAERNGLVVIEDAAQSFGATYKGRYSCSMTDVGCTSFFPAKPLGAYGDAGACFTGDDAIATVLRQVRDHGQDRRYHHIRLGINGRMDSLQAAVLLAKIEILDDEIHKRQEIADRYDEELTMLEDNHQVILPKVQVFNTSSWAQYTIRVNDREAVQEALKIRAIPTAVHYPLLLSQQPVLFQTGQDLPHSICAARQAISLPMHPYLRADDQSKIIRTLTEVVKCVSPNSKVSGLPNKLK